MELVKCYINNNDGDDDDYKDETDYRIKATKRNKS